MSGAEVIGSVLGVIGGLLVALQCRISVYGFGFYALSNIAFIAFGLHRGHYGIVAMNAVFLVLAALGVWRYGRIRGLW